MERNKKLLKKRFEYGEAPSLNVVANMMCEKMQETTMHYGTRSFGISILLGCTSDGPKLIQIQTNGEAQQATASVVGNGSADIQKYLEENYNADTLDSEEAAVTLALKALLQK